MTDDDLKELIKGFDFNYEDVTDKYYLETIREATEKRDEIQKAIDDLCEGTNNLNDGIQELNNVRIAAAAGDVLINKYAGLAVGVIMMILFTYVISVFVIHQIQKESSVIGALYALGVKKKDLIRHYITLPTIIAFIGGIIGALVGFSPFGVNMQMQDVKKLYLNGNTLITAVAAIVLIPIAKISMDKVFPLFIPNVASGINLKFPPYMYLIIFVGVMLVYFVVNLLLVRKLNRITPAEVLKNRE